MNLENNFQENTIKNRLREKIISTLFTQVNNTKSYELKQEVPINLVDFNYLQSTDLFKLKILLHTSLTLLDDIINYFMANSRENPLMQIFDELKNLMKENQIKNNNELSVLKSVIKEQKDKILIIKPFVQRMSIILERNVSLNEVKNITDSNKNNIRKFLNIKIHEENKKLSGQEIEEVLIRKAKIVEKLGKTEIYDKDNYLQLLETTIHILEEFQKFSEQHQNCGRRKSSVSLIKKQPKLLNEREKSSKPVSTKQTLNRDVSFKNFNEKIQKKQLPDIESIPEQQVSHRIKSKKQLLAPNTSHFPINKKIDQKSQRDLSNKKLSMTDPIQQPNLQFTINMINDNSKDLLNKILDRTQEMMNQFQQNGNKKNEQIYDKVNRILDNIDKEGREQTEKSIEKKQKRQNLLKKNKKISPMKNKTFSVAKMNTKKHQKIDKLNEKIEQMVESNSLESKKFQKDSSDDKVLTYTLEDFKNNQNLFSNSSNRKSIKTRRLQNLNTQLNQITENVD